MEITRIGRERQRPFYRSRDGLKALQLVGRTSDRIGSTHKSVKQFFLRADS